MRLYPVPWRVLWFSLTRTYWSELLHNPASCHRLLTTDCVLPGEESVTSCCVKAFHILQLLLVRVVVQLLTPTVWVRPPPPSLSPPPPSLSQSPPARCPAACSKELDHNWITERYDKVFSLLLLKWTRNCEKCLSKEALLLLSVSCIRDGAVFFIFWSENRFV